LTRIVAAFARHAERVAFGLFLLGLGLFVFVAGMAAGRFKLPPYRAFDAAKDAAVALKDKYWVAEQPFAYKTARERGGVLRSDPERAYPGFTLFTGYSEGSFGARLIDLQGRLVHRWDVAFSEVWPGTAPHISDRAPDKLVTWHGVHLFPNGDLLLNFQGGNFPGGGGLVRLRKDSSIAWSLARNTHHDMDVLPDGRILVPAHAWRETGIPACARLLDPPYHEDQLLLVSPEGKVEHEMSVLGALCRSPFRSLFSVTGLDAGTWRGRIETDDPTHLNNVDLVTEDTAKPFPMARPGDVLVSLRNLNAIGFLDPRGEQFRWLLAGPFIRQHDPDLLPDGKILLFDNRGGGGGDGTERSRVIAIDPATQAIGWRFEGNGDDALWSEKMGNQQLLPNGNVLITESWGGRILEVTRAPEPEVVWEYVNLLPPVDGVAKVGLISQALRFGAAELPFLDRPESPSADRGNAAAAPPSG